MSTRYAIPSRTSHYFTEGKLYPILEESAPGTLLGVFDDKGILRFISGESGARSAHLPPLDRDSFPDSALGTFDIVDVPAGFQIVPGMWGNRPVPDHVALAYYLSDTDDEFDEIKAALKGER